MIATCYKASRLRPPKDLAPYVSVVRLVVDRFLLAQGEAFAAAVHRGAFDVAEMPDLVSDTRKELAEAQVDPGAHGRVPDVLASAAELILGEPSVEMQRYLRTFADSYTLFAFLRETPDVQSAIVKMFSSGEVWLDTTVVLPLFAEELLDAARDRQYTAMLGAARESGLQLFVTEGVLEEIESHMARSHGRRRSARAPQGLTGTPRAP